MKSLEFGDRYSMIEHLATGGMAEVYLATFRPKKGFSKKVVIKKILKPYEKDPRWMNSFLKEVQIMALLNHSNIVQIYDFGKSKSGYFFSMEYVDGESLLYLKSQTETIPKKFILFMGLEILKGLSHAHAQGVLHRDLSPSNILISKEGEVKITDFGVAKLLSESLEPTQFMKGKKAYMSPEQKAKKPISSASDIYSLSVVLYELLTGEIYDSKNRAQLESFHFLKEGLCEDPSDRVIGCEIFEEMLERELKISNDFVTQREFSQYLSQFSLGESRKTLHFSPEPPSPMEFRQRVKQWKKWVRWGGLSLWLSVLGGSVPLFLSHGYLSLNVKPWGEVFYGRKSLGFTPFVHRRLPTGRHRLIVSNHALEKTKIVTIDIRPNEETKMSFSF